MRNWWSSLVFLMAVVLIIAMALATAAATKAGWL